MKIKKLSQKGAYSSARYLYASLKTMQDNGAILVLPKESNMQESFESVNMSGTYHYKGFTFTDESVYKHCSGFNEAKELFNKTDCPVAIIKDITNKEVYSIEK